MLGLQKLFSRSNGSSGNYSGGSIAYPSNWILNLFGAHSKSGTKVTAQTVLGISAVWCAIRILSETMASLPLHLYERKSNGDVIQASNHPLDRLVSAEPSDLYTSFTFRESCQAHLCTHGNAYARIIRDGAARVKELILLEPRNVQPILNIENELKYEVWVHNKMEVLDPVHILHIPALAMNGLVGMSPIQAHRENLGLSLATVDYGSYFFKNGAHIKGVLTHPKVLKPEAAKNLRKTFSNLFSGLDNTGSTPVLEEGMKFEKVSLTPQDAMFVQTRQLQVSEVARIFRIPPHMLGDLERATFSNIEHQAQEFVTHTVRPWVKRWEQELDRKLLAENEKGRFFFRFNLEGLLRGDTQSRAEYFSKLFMIGVLSRNDIRRLENLNSIEGGDKYYVPLSMTSEPENNSDE